MAWATFSPDGSRLVVTTNDGPAVHVWDLRAIRRHLAEMGLDWDAPAYSDDDPASPALRRLASAPGRPRPAGRARRTLHRESAETLIERYTARLKNDPNDAEAYHHRAHALVNLNRLAGGDRRLHSGHPPAARRRAPPAFRGRIHANASKQLRARDRRPGGRAVREPDQPYQSGNPGQVLQQPSLGAGHGPGPASDLDPRAGAEPRAVELAPGSRCSSTRWASSSIVRAGTPRR